MRAHQQGMTLLEVIVAIMIFAVVAVALLTSITLNTKGEMQLQEKSIASWVADNQLAQAALHKQLFPETPQQGQSEMYGRIWYWSQVGYAAPEYHMWRNRVEVRTSPEQQEPIAQLTTWTAIPEEKTNGDPAR